VEGFEVAKLFYIRRFKTIFTVSVKEKTMFTVFRYILFGRRRTGFYKNLHCSFLKNKKGGSLDILAQYGCLN